MLRGNGQPGAPPDPDGADKNKVLQESLKILTEMWTNLITKVEATPGGSDDDLVLARKREMEALLEAASSKIDKATVDRAWVLYRNVMNEVNRLYFDTREG
eukprot:4668233-Prymnesium_polylepis.1